MSIQNDQKPLDETQAGSGALTGCARGDAVLDCGCGSVG